MSEWLPWLIFNDYKFNNKYYQRVNFRKTYSHKRNNYHMTIVTLVTEFGARDWYIKHRTILYVQSVISVCT